MDFELVGPLEHVETIAVGRAIRALPRLRKQYGGTRWRKLKAIGRVRLPDDTISKAELHWFECHGVGRKEMKIKRLID